MSLGGETIPDDDDLQPTRGAPAVSNPDAPAPTSTTPPASEGTSSSTPATDTTGPTPDAQATTAQGTETVIDRTQRILAILQGAIEGLQESLAREEVGKEAARAYAVVRETATGVRDEVREVGRDESMQRAGAAISSGATVVGEKATSAKEAMGEQAEAVRAKVSETKEAVVTRAQATVENVKAKAGAVRETTSRATKAPGRILSDVGEGAKGWATAMGAMLGIYVVAAALGITFLAIFAIWLVVALNEVLPDPWGTLVAALFFALAAGVAVLVARNRSREASESVAEARRKVREDIDYVKRPVRREFGARRGV